MIPEKLPLPQKIVLNERKDLTISGVTEVLRFDDSSVSLQTSLGLLEIQGQELQLKALTADSGQVTVTGHICGLFFEDPSPVRGLWSRLFK